MAKETLTAKVSPRTLKRLEQYADEEGISKSEATDRMVKQGLDVQDSDMRLVPIQTDGGTRIENELGEIESEVSGLRGQYQRTARLNAALLVAVVYIGLEVTVNPPAILMIVTGIAILASLVRPLLQGGSP